MNNNIITISLFLLSLNIYSQDIMEIKKQETIFVFFEESKTNTIFKSGRKVNDSIIYNYDFEYLFFDKNNRLNKEFWLSYNDYQGGFDDLLNKVNKSTIFKINKSFLRKNKDIIITGKLVDKLGKSDFFKLLEKAKTIYLINKAEIENGLITVREVRLSYYPEE